MTAASFDLTGRVALVTGAGSAEGIGMACARLLGELGASVAVTATTSRIHDRARELSVAGVRGSSHVADLTDPSQVEALLVAVLREHGHLDVLVNNAGMTSVSSDSTGSGESGGLASLDLAGWQRALDRNLTTAFLACRAALPALLSSPAGRIVNVASVTGPVAAMAGEVGYAAGKAGLVGLTRALAVDLARHGITVNAVAPGWIDTPSLTAPERALGSGTPVGRCGTPAEVASAVGWLASPGGAYVTGQVVVVDGGNMVAEERVVL